MKPTASSNWRRPDGLLPGPSAGHRRGRRPPGHLGAGGHAHVRPARDVRPRPSPHARSSTAQPARQIEHGRRRSLPGERQHVVDLGDRRLPSVWGRQRGQERLPEGVVIEPLAGHGRIVRPCCRDPPACHGQSFAKFGRRRALPVRPPIERIQFDMLQTECARQPAAERALAGAGARRPCPRSGVAARPLEWQLRRGAGRDLAVGGQNLMRPTGIREARAQTARPLEPLIPHRPRVW